jgi:hypothetical protein
MEERSRLPAAKLCAALLFSILFTSDLIPLHSDVMQAIVTFATHLCEGLMQSLVRLNTYCCSLLLLHLSSQSPLLTGNVKHKESAGQKASASHLLWSMYSSD